MVLDVTGPRNYPDARAKRFPANQCAMWFNGDSECNAREQKPGDRENAGFFYGT